MTFSTPSHRLYLDPMLRTECVPTHRPHKIRFGSTNLESWIVLRYLNMFQHKDSGGSNNSIPDEDVEVADDEDVEVADDEGLPTGTEQ